MQLDIDGIPEKMGTGWGILYPCRLLAEQGSCIFQLGSHSLFYSPSLVCRFLKGITLPSLGLKVVLMSLMRLCSRLP